jgi:ubiquinone/menaquinone biosynthesis C-methylase UbiE
MTTVETSEVYDAAAQSYSRSHARWLRFGGGEAQSAFEGAVTAFLRPGLRMLDVACGTGIVARRVLRGVDIDLVLLDASQQMLNLCHDIPARRVKRCMKQLPFDEDSFDIVTCAWSLERLIDPRPAFENCRKLRLRQDLTMAKGVGDLPIR